MPLTLSDQDLAELNNEVMGEMRGKELRILMTFLQAKITRQQQEIAASNPEAPSLKSNGHAATEAQPNA